MVIQNPESLWISEDIIIIIIIIPSSVDVSVSRTY
jgi:hypothetical protein